jgi:hypothetical protein
MNGEAFRPVEVRWLCLVLMHCQVRRRTQDGLDQEQSGGKKMLKI